METKARQAYDLIQCKASLNEIVQGLSGVLGFPFTMIADVGVIFTHYGPMLNGIRSIYNRDPVTTEAIKPIIDGCKSEVLADIIVDKLIGNIPGNDETGFRRAAARIISSFAIRRWRRTTRKRAGRTYPRSRTHAFGES